MNPGSFRLGLALEGTGWHPASWLLSSVTDAEEVFKGGYWTDWGRAAASGGVDFVTLEDGLSLQTDRFGTADQAHDRVRGRLDPIVTAAVLLATTDISEVVVSRNVTHSNPFHVAVQMASLAAIGPGRVTWRPQVSADARDATVVGGPATPQLRPEDVYVPTRIARRLRDLFRDAEDYVRTVRELWKTFPAESLSSGDTFLHRDMVAPLRLTGRERYPAAGPLTVPVPSTPKVAVLAHHALEPYRLAAAVADRVFVTPSQEHPIPALLTAFREIEQLTPDAAGTEVYADVAVVLGDTAEHAEARLARLNETAGFVWAPDTQVFVGTADRLARELTRWREQFGLSGVRLRPAVLSDDGARIVQELVR
ncbi:LLM class flavin-dependent oxidoreductase [Streptomyces sp. NBC_00638]|uniref:LLM class flavin-dependent oxidoreductase n=1 Tax=Streptomyces sp. NBC_00638 TaxID=2975794 RepID=UPI002253B995|nr:LLM class flavin-dependent oxidoreductase [Streptomyces sp. NBC_00638]MCX5008423.1 LLM class flavin-dependent oxidoreductase [Streptomyces sp. NBC_00638]